MSIFKHLNFSSEAFREARESHVDYTFGFDTSNFLDLNLESSAHLEAGYWMNLRVLRSAPRTLTAEAECTQQIRTLYELSASIDLLWIQLDPESGEIIGRWMASR